MRRLCYGQIIIRGNREAHLLGLTCLFISLQSFFAEIYAEAVKAKPGPGHWAIAGMAEAGRLRRHYTLNIDGLAEAAGMSVWQPTHNPTGLHTSDACIPPQNAQHGVR